MPWAFQNYFLWDFLTIAQQTTDSGEIWSLNIFSKKKDIYLSLKLLIFELKVPVKSGVACYTMKYIEQIVSISYNFGINRSVVTRSNLQNIFFMTINRFSCFFGPVFQVFTYFFTIFCQNGATLHCFGTQFA